MDGATAQALRRYANGELSSRQMRDMTDLDYSEVLDGLEKLVLRPPRYNFDGPNGADFRRGYETLLAIFDADEASRDRNTGRPER